MRKPVSEFGEQLARARKARGLSQAELAEKMGIHQSHVSDIERGRVDPRVSTLVEMARLLGMELHLTSKIYDATHYLTGTTISAPFPWGTLNPPSTSIADFIRQQDPEEEDW